MAKRKWRKSSLPLASGHGWKGAPGCRVFVADRGAVRFDIPEAWVLEPDRGSVKFYDRKPPGDDCCLEMSYLRLPRADWRALPVAGLVDEVVPAGRPDVERRLGPFEADRPGIEIAWLEEHYIDPGERRLARQRTGIARGSGIQCLLTLVYWADDSDRVEPVWDTVLRTLALGQWVADPQRGPGPD